MSLPACGVEGCAICPNPGSAVQIFCQQPAVQTIPPLRTYGYVSWICVRCGRSNAPFVSQCPCYPR